MSKKSNSRSSHAVHVRSYDPLRRSPRFLSLETMKGKRSLLHHIYGKGSVESHLVNLSKPSRKLTSRSSLIVGSPKPPLRRSARFLPPEKLKSVETHPSSLSISSKLKQETSYKMTRQGIYLKSQLKLSRLDFDGVLEEAQNCFRRSPRLASETGTKAFKIPRWIPHGNRTRQSLRQLGKAPVSAENAKQGIEHFKASNEVEKKLVEMDCKFANSQISRRSTRFVSVVARGGKDCNEQEVIVKSNPSKTLKKDCVYTSSQIRRSSRNLTSASNGVLKKGATLNITDQQEVAKRPNADREALILEPRIADGFFSTKTTEHHKDKRRKREEDNGVENRIVKIENEDCHVTVAWTTEQEALLQNAYLLAKPSPHFWKKVSTKVPGKSAQDCFDKIHASIATPLSCQRQLKTRRTSLSPICNFSLSGIISPHVSELEAGRLRSGRTKKLAAQKFARHLLRKHSLTDQVKAIDRFSLLESSPISISSIAPHIQSPKTSSRTLNSHSLPQHPCKKLSSNSEAWSRLKLLASPTDPSPQVLKKIKDRALHDRYIDQLHNREARRAGLAKKSNYCVGGKSKHGDLKAARTVLIADAVSFVNHFRDSQASAMHELEAGEHDDFYDDDDEDEDIEVDE